MEKPMNLIQLITKFVLILAFTVFVFHLPLAWAYFGGMMNGIN